MIEILSKFLVLCLSILRVAFILVLILSVFGLVLPYLSGVSSYAYLSQVVSWENSLNHLVKDYIPTRIGGFELSRVITIVIALLLIDLTRNISDRIKFLAQRIQMRKELKKIQQAYQSSPQKDKIALLESKMEQVNQATGKNRQELLKDFANIKKELEKIGRDLAFLAIDVVDSTGMKVGEDPASVESDFIEYHNYVEAKFKEHGLIKAAWTPDGVMACFNTVENAVQAAQDIIQGLEYFNRNVKLMKKDFAIRCGVNGGRVFYDDSIPLEQFSDRVIDIAGHMQKHAPPNTILIAKQMIEPVTSRENFVPTERVVDGLEVCEWISEENKPKNEKL